MYNHKYIYIYIYAWINTLHCITYIHTYTHTHIYKYTYLRARTYVVDLHACYSYVLMSQWPEIYLVKLSVFVRGIPKKLWLHSRAISWESNISTLSTEYGKSILKQYLLYSHHLWQFSHYIILHITSLAETMSLNKTKLTCTQYKLIFN